MLACVTCAASYGGMELTFVEVVEAMEQVVSGIKYYIKISAMAPHGDSRLFDSVVLVKPWFPSKQLLNFSPGAW
ncbi:hypothetical protein VNO78_11239 [Psophocarpus tetragonolobus]|uniref:Cystatin domain-containing protein n=1 Tax=Psophocarpus tetragonolobus TaxID=3891 RepID=A0AAN9SL40_PSOTE